MLNVTSACAWLPVLCWQGEGSNISPFSSNRAVNRDNNWSKTTPSNSDSFLPPPERPIPCVFWRACALQRVRKRQRWRAADSVWSAPHAPHPRTHTAHTHSYTTSTSNGNTAFSKNDFKGCVWFLCNLDKRVNARGIGLVIVYGELHHLFFAPSLFKSSFWLQTHGRESSAFLP